MKRCQSCGEYADDTSVYCTKCGGFLMQLPEANFQATEQAYQTGNAQTTAQQTPNPYMYTQAASPAPKKKSSKKALFITLGVVAVLAIAFCVWFFIFRKSGSSAEKKIKKETEAYVNAIEDFDIKKLIELTIPKDLLKKIAVALADNGEFDTSMLDFEDAEDLEKDFDEIYDSSMSLLSVYINQAISQSNVKIDIKDYEVTSVEKFDYKKILDALEIDSYTLNEIESSLSAYSKEYGIDLDEIYNVYVTFDASISVDGESSNANSKLLLDIMKYEFDAEDFPFDYVDKDGGVALFTAYQYDGEYYMIPSVGIFLPSLLRYTNKSKMTNDIITAQSIKTAVEMLIASESAYEYFTSTGAEIYFAVTEDGFSRMPEEYAQELREYLGIYDAYPMPKYTDDGQTHFSFKVDYDGYITIYVAGDNSESDWEIYPDLDPHYQ